MRQSRTLCAVQKSSSTFTFLLLSCVPHTHTYTHNNHTYARRDPVNSLVFHCAFSSPCNQPLATTVVLSCQNSPHLSVTATV